MNLSDIIFFLAIYISIHGTKQPFYKGTI